MSYTFTLLLIAQVGCEWVEISQQHYQKPLRSTYNHPLLASGAKFGEPARSSHPISGPVRPANNHPLGTPKVSEDERTTKRNRIYINHTLPDTSWDPEIEQKWPSSKNGVKLKSSLVNFDEEHEFVNKKPSASDEFVLNEANIKRNVVVIRKAKPGGDKSDGHQSSVAENGIRIHPSNRKVTNIDPNPLEEYKGSIEVLNLSDIDYTTAEDTFNMELQEDMENKIKRKGSHTTPKESNRRKIGTSSTSKPKDLYNQRYIKPNVEPSTKYPTTLKEVTNMRRVEIIRSTKPTPIDKYDDDTTFRVTTSPKHKVLDEERIKNSATRTTSYKFPHLGHVKRVNVSTNTTKVTRKPKPDNKFTATEFVDDEVNFTEQSEETVDDNIHRVDRPISRYRATTEKTFSVRTKPENPKNEIRIQNQKVPDPEEAMLEEIITSDEKQYDIKIHKVASIGSIKRVPNPTKIAKIEKTTLNRLNSITQVTSNIDADEETMVEDEDPTIHYNNHHIIHDIASSTEEVPIETTLKSKPKENGSTRKPDKVSQIEKPDKASKNPSDFESKEDEFNNNAGFKITAERNNKYKPPNRLEKPKEPENQPKNNTSKNTKENKQADEKTDKDDEEDPLSSDRKNNAMENLIKFLKTVTVIITKSTRRGVRGKLQYLEDLRDTILANIEERLEAAFPDDDAPSSGARRARSAEPRGHVEFPSSEGALMTISFLTFAVFLIKLVLQVIQAYKNKTMMMMPTVVAAVGRAYSDHRANN